MLEWLIERLIKLLPVLGDIANILLAVLAVLAVTKFLDLASFFSDRQKYKKMSEEERDILKAIMSNRIGTLIRKDGDVSQSIRLIPKEEGADVWNSHLSLSGLWYGAALESLNYEGYIRKADREDGKIYSLTPSGKRFIERFARKLRSHQYPGRVRYAGRVRDDVHHAKMQRLNNQYILGTVHAAIGTEPLGVETDPYANIVCIPPKKQKDGVVAHAYIIAKELPVVNGDTVFVKFEDVPYHIRTYLTPRWAGNRFLGEEEKQVPTAIFTVKDIQQANGNQILVLSPGRLMREVTTGDKNDKA